MILEVPNRPPTQKDQGPMQSRGRPRKTPVTVARSPVTLAATSRNEEIGTTEVDESDAFDPGATQPHGEVQSARQTLPRRPKSEFDKAFSEFRSSQILRGTQPEPARPAEQVTAVENVKDGEEGEEPEIMVDAAAASSLSQKDLPYELETTSYSILDSNDSSTGLANNSSSGLHTLFLRTHHPQLGRRRYSDGQDYGACSRFAKLKKEAVDPPAAAASASTAAPTPRKRKPKPKKAASADDDDDEDEDTPITKRSKVKREA
ncbi:hypothetical protein KCU93_g10436, partial [Aureobasidium melanogenum]